MINIIYLIVKQSYMLVITELNVRIKKLCAKNKDRWEFREPINLAVEEAKFFYYSDFGQEYYSHRGHLAETPFCYFI